MPCESKNDLTLKRLGFLRVVFSGMGQFEQPPASQTPNNLLKVDWKRKKMVTSSVICWHDQFLCNNKLSKNPKKSMKIVNIDGENLRIIWTIGEISMKFSEKMWLMIIKKKKSSASPHV